MTIAELRKTRMAQGLSLTEISRTTRIGVAHLRHIEEGDLNALPPGFYARAFIRAYADAIGVDPDMVLGGLADRLPAAQAADAPHPTSRAQQALPWADAATLIPDARMQVLRQLLNRHNESVAREAQTHPPVQASTQAQADTALAVAGATGRGERRVLAATFDGLLLCAIYLTVLDLTAITCAVSVRELLGIAPLEVCTVLGLITALYLVLMGGVAGRTIGAMLLDVPLIERARRPLDLGAIARRSVDCVRADVTAAAAMVTSIPSLLTRSRRAA